MTEIFETEDNIQKPEPKMPVEVKIGLAIGLAFVIFFAWFVRNKYDADRPKPVLTIGSQE